MRIKIDEEEVILNEELKLYNVSESIEAKTKVIVNGKEMSVKEFREQKDADPKKGYWGNKRRYEILENEHEIN